MVSIVSYCRKRLSLNSHQLYSVRIIAERRVWCLATHSSDTSTRLEQPALPLAVSQQIDRILAVLNVDMKISAALCAVYQLPFVFVFHYWLITSAFSKHDSKVASYTNSCLVFQCQMWICSNIQRRLVQGEAQTTIHFRRPIPSECFVSL